MIIYEVNLNVERNIAREYQNWLEKHINDMLTFDGFEKAMFFERKEESNTQIVCFTTHYHISSMDQLQDYFQNHAEKMRADGIRRFGDLFKSDRRILSLLKEY